MRESELFHAHVICNVLVCLIENNVGDFFQDDIPVAVLGFTAAGLAQSVECLTCRAGGRGFESRGRTNTAFSLQTARPSHDSDDHVNLRSRLHLGT